MSVKTPTSDLRLTALHCPSLSWRDEKQVLLIATCLIQEKGANATCRDTKGLCGGAAGAYQGQEPLASLFADATERSGGLDSHSWIATQNKKEEKAAAAVAMATRIQAAKEAMSELCSELEAEEEAAAAAGSEKKGGKAGTGKNKKKK